ncbi:uncharacterized protein A4U43_C07F21930 [Asparagus officinalis]|uniref:ABCF3 PWI-like helical bundle domain-containing protein n=1 Tax=Asparagus officinalis TaxID=4686 RepID=A0A5P1EDV7_ASPOF|nr:uncharacterized protein A4U43_C07F21930 [Asparagus officinalis]
MPTDPDPNFQTRPNLEPPFSPNASPKPTKPDPLSKPQLQNHLKSSHFAGARINRARELNNGGSRELRSPRGPRPKSPRDKPIIDYIVNVLADDDFDFGLDGDGAFDAIGELLVDSGCVIDFSECRSVCNKLSEKFGRHGLVKPKLAVRSLTTPLRMFDGMDEEAPKKKEEVFDGPLLSERDRAKLERRKRKDDRQREASPLSSV